MTQGRSASTLGPKIIQVIWVFVAIYGFYLIMNDGFFRHELTFDGIIGIIAIALGVTFTIATWYFRYWRTNHAIRVAYSLDTYEVDGPFRKCPHPECAEENRERDRAAFRWGMLEDRATMLEPDRDR